MKIYGWILSLIFMNQSFGYSFTSDFNQGYYWPNFPILMKISASNQQEADSIQDLVNQSVNQWEDAIGQDIWEIDQTIDFSGDISGNVIRWSNSFAEETGFDPVRTLAVTVRYQSGTFIGRTEIILNGNLDYLRQNFSLSLAKTILHEFGHTIGLDHSQEEAIMTASIGSIYSIQNDDVAGANAVVDEAKRRQATGFIAPQIAQDESSSSSSSPFGCGSIDLSGPGDGQGGNPLASLFVGLALAFFIRQKLPRRDFFSIKR